VLAVDVDQALAQLAQLADGGRAAVDPGAALALGVDTAAQQQRSFAVIVEAGLGQPGGQRPWAVELGGDLGARRALAHHAGVGAVAERELQRVDQDGLAGARLAGQRGEAGLQLQLECRHDDDVAQRQAAQHQPFPVPGSAPSFQCSLRRSVA
jgi:hypothetical protein